MDKVINRAADIWSDILRHQGYCILPNALPETVIFALDNELAPAFDETPFGQGGFYGETTKRFGRLLARSQYAAALVQNELVLAIVEQILSPFCDRIQLNVAQAIAIHPGAPAQLPHRDQDMWRAPAGEAEYLVNVIWPLTPFRAENGATMVWPQSHGAHALELLPHNQPVAPEMNPGSALMFLGSTLHGAGGNKTRHIRRGAVVGYSLGWLKPYENQWLAYPPAIARTFAPDLAALVGYQQHRPNLGNYEGQCPSVLLNDDQRGVLGAIDALRPDQQLQLEAFLASQRHSA
jgi:ectoine hydroxylase-related dioxygenase (phytanoyl-CoA dioxygenase family)